jgi:hypothetical protein
MGFETGLKMEIQKVLNHLNFEYRISFRNNDELTKNGPDNN